MKLSGKTLAGVAAPVLLLAGSRIVAQAPLRDTTPMINRSSNPLLANFRFRSIGPASMGGRIDDIEVVAERPAHHLGRLRRRRRVQVGEQRHDVRARVRDVRLRVDRRHRDRSDQSRTSSTSAPAKPNNRQTSSFGDGIYKTTDGGKTFTNIGLRETQTIARIVIDPRHPTSSTSRRPGHLFGPNPERGIYKTTDGGKTWDKIKYVDENTGFTDIAIDPSNSNVLYAASYQRRRTDAASTAAARAARSGRPTDAGQHVEQGSRATDCRRALRPHRARRRALESERRLRADRSGEEPAATPLPKRRRRASAAAGGAGGGGAAAYRLVQQRGTGSRIRRRSRRRADAAPPTRLASRPRSSDSARASIRSDEQGPHVDAREQLQRTAALLQPTFASIPRTTK